MKSKAYRATAVNRVDAGQVGRVWQIFREVRRPR
jgi:hypothetical protein